MASGIQMTRVDKRKLHQLIRQTPDRADALLRGLAQDVVNDIVQSFGSSPSAPGEPPGVDTGALRASMRWSPGRPLEYFVHDGVEYGAYLEMGSEHVAPRPFIAPVIEDYRRGRFAQFARDFGIFD